jgi:hypothetical protein
MAQNPGLRKTDPTYIEMEEIIRSDEGRKAAIDAAKKGMPALSGIDPLLREKLGDRYQVIDQGTRCAGDLVRILMHELGYKRHPRARLPDGCLARSAILWTPD